ncbi:retropepsin-like aspartic protease family protein [Aliikangiella maris]|uniref:TIGR02281 family clan AA aspartic protease n=2 Tax=Aliikangiella maris TaxID=3162458 RepID=A0ABV2BTW0_9GAMM
MSYQSNQPPEHPNDEANHQPNSTEKIGRNMMFIAWGFAILLATWIFGMWEQKQINPNTSPVSHRVSGATEVVLKANRAGHYVSAGLINQKPVTFIVDTGATSVAVPGELQQQLGLISGRSMYAETANGTAQAFQTEIRRLDIGDITLYNVQASIIPNMRGKEVLLGMSVLKQLDFAQKGQQLILRQNH